MTRRFRLLAGPNGSGKTTLKRRLEADYAVNFYDFLNADEIFAEVTATRTYAPRLPVAADDLVAYATASSYPEAVTRPFRDGTISIAEDCVRFATAESVTSYTVALLTGFLQSEHLRQGASFSQETVFSHPSKIAALASAQSAGFRTYLYFVATEVPEINLGRVANRADLGGHAVPPEKIVSRHARALANAKESLPYLSRAFFFDNSEETMRYLGTWNREEGLSAVPADARPAWFAHLVPAFGPSRGTLSGDTVLAKSAVAASRAAVAEAFAAGLPITVLRDGRVVRLSSDGREEVCA